MKNDDVIGRVTAARTPQELDDLISRPELHSREVVEQLAKAVLVFMRRDWDQADLLARAASRIADLTDDGYSRGLGDRSLAHMAYIRGHCEEALDHYASAERRFREVGETIERGVTLSSSLQSLILLGRYTDAFAAAEQARKIFESADTPLLTARLDCNVGNILHRLDRMEEAIEHYRRALEVFQSEKADPQDLAAVLMNMAVCQIAVNLFAEAVASYETLHRHCLKNDMPAVLAQADYNIAYLYYRRGEYTQAIELYAVASEHCREVGDSQHLALCHLDLAELYLELNLTAEARKQAESSLAAFKELGLRLEVAKSLVFLAIAAHQEGNAFLALSLFAESRERFDSEGNEAWAALVDFYRALILQEEGRSVEAHRMAEKALPHFVESTRSNKATLCELLLARIELAAGRPESALEQCDTVCASLAGLDMPTVSYQAFLTRGQVSEALDDLESAARDYRRAFDYLENPRSQLRGEELKIAFVKDKQAVYESLIWVSLIDAPSPEARVRAFEYSERAKSRSFADLLAFPTHAPPLSAGADVGLVNEMRRLRAELNWYYRETDLRELESLRALDEELQGEGIAASEALPTRPAIGADSEELNRLSRQREDQLIEILTEMQSQNTDLTLQLGGSRDLEAIRAALPPGGKLLQYYQARQTIFAFVVGYDSLEVRPVTTVSSVRHIQSLLQFELSKFRLGPGSPESQGESLELETRFHLQQLYEELLAPIRSAIDCEHLVIVPHRSLHYVPFHALHDGGGYLLDSLVVSYAPSASVFEICTTRPAAPSQGAIVLGVPDPGTPLIEEEARAVASLLPDSRLLLGPDARLDAISGDGNGSRARLLHIATQGFFRSDNPMFSAIQIGDSRLALFDLYHLNVAADLVVLSGCGTGLNSVETGDELIGLTRGLLFAGARTVVATLWDARDRSTTELMKHFYSRLGEHSNHAAALREAMLELRETHPHPYYWAPFVLSGAPFAAGDFVSV